jgi:hypothetical protein
MRVNNELKLTLVLNNTTKARPESLKNTTKAKKKKGQLCAEIRANYELKLET